MESTIHLQFFSKVKLNTLLMNVHLLAYFLGIFIVFVSHAYMLVYPNKQFLSMQQHIYANLLACALVAYYFTAKEGFIKF